jgi:hypothetical protein
VKSFLAKQTRLCRARKSVCSAVIETVARHRALGFSSLRSQDRSHVWVAPMRRGNRATTSDHRELFRPSGGLGLERAEPPPMPGSPPAARSPQAPPAGEVPRYRRNNPDLWRFARWVPHAFVFVAELLVAAAELPALPATMYVLAGFALIMLIWEVDDPPARSVVWQLVWPLGWALIAVLGFSQRPSIGYCSSFTLFFWAFTIAEWRCATEAQERIPDGLVRRLAAYKKALGRGSRVAGATGLAGFAAVAGAFGTTITIMHRETTSPALVVQKAPGKSRQVDPTPEAGAATAASGNSQDPA